MRINEGRDRRSLAQPLRYPAVPLETGTNDSRVEPWNAAKMAARLQAADTRNVALLRVDFDSGHFMAGRSKDSVDQEFADDFTFILAHTGDVRPSSPRGEGIDRGRRDRSR